MLILQLLEAVNAAETGPDCTGASEPSIRPCTDFDSDSSVNSSLAWIEPPTLLPSSNGANWIRILFLDQNFRNSVFAGAPASSSSEDDDWFFNKKSLWEFSRWLCKTRTQPANSCGLWTVFFLSFLLEVIPPLIFFFHSFISRQKDQS